MFSARILRGIAVAISLALAAAVLSGCHEPRTASVEAEPVVTEDLTPSATLEKIQLAIADVKSTGELYKSNPLGFRRKQLEEQIREGLHNADRLLQHSDSTTEQKSAATIAKLELLELGTKYGCGGCQEALNDFAAQLNNHSAGSPEAEAASALLLQQTVESDKPHDEIMAALKRHTELYASGKLGLRCYQAYAEKLCEKQKLQEARQVCLIALDAYRTHADTTSTQRLLQAIHASQAQMAAEMAANQGFLREVYQRVGNRNRGYFVIDAHERGSGFVRVDYSVCHGIDEVAANVKGLPSGWEWELHAWFPDTPDGLVQANEDYESMMKRTTTMPVFGN